MIKKIRIKPYKKIGKIPYKNHKGISSAEGNCGGKTPAVKKPSMPLNLPEGSWINLFEEVSKCGNDSDEKD